MWKFDNIYKETIWGGTRIAAFLNKKLDSDHVGECWQLSAVPGSESIVADGPDKGLTLSELVAREGDSLLGKRNHARYGNVFPLLIKILDANDNLSVQVHPDDRMARRLGAPNGKSEMWYVLDSAPKASLINGLAAPVSADRFRDSIADGTLLSLLNYHHIKAGEVYFVPAGRVHALGRGAMVVEIQQTSDITYRIYDYDRTDAAGNRRQLHIDRALEAINFDDDGGSPIPYRQRLNFPVNLISAPFFTTNILELDSELMRDYSEWDTFVAIVATKGKATLRSGGVSAELTAGETILIPADASGVSIKPHGRFTALETFIK